MFRFLFKNREYRKAARVMATYEFSVHWDLAELGINPNEIRKMFVNDCGYLIVQSSVDGQVKSYPPEIDIEFEFPIGMRIFMQDGTVVWKHDL